MAILSIRRYGFLDRAVTQFMSVLVWRSLIISGEAVMALAKERARPFNADAPAGVLASRACFASGIPGELPDFRGFLKWRF